MNGAKGLNLHQHKRLFLQGPDSDLGQAHLAYVARAEIKMSILSFSFVQLWGRSRLPAGPIHRCRRRFLRENKTTLDASHLYTHNIWIEALSMAFRMSEKCCVSIIICPNISFSPVSSMQATQLITHRASNLVSIRCHTCLRKGAVKVYRSWVWVMCFAFPYSTARRC